MKKPFFLILIPIFIFLSACAGTTTYKNDVAVSALQDKVADILRDDEGMTIVPESYITNIMKLDLSAFSEYVVVKQATGSTIDEYGIFKSAKDMDSTAINGVTEYLAVTKSSSMVADYMPEEAPKLEGAEVRRIGDYIVYCILADEVKDAVFSAIEDELSVK